MRYWYLSFFVIVLAFVLDCPIGQSQAMQESRPLVLTGATVLDGLGNPPLREAVIWIEGDRIKAFGGKGTSYPADASVVDLSGKFVIPGLVDMHVHFRPWLGEVFLNHGVTTIMVPGGEGFPVAEREASYRRDARSPRIFGTAGRPEVTPSMTREEVRAAVREWLTKKPDYASLPVFDESNRQAYQWTAEEIHEAGLMVFGHTESAPESVRAGQDVVEHLWGFSQALMSPQELEGYQEGKYLHWGLFFKDTARMKQLIREAVGRGAYLNPTMVYELGSQTPLAHRHELELYNLYRDHSLMTYYPENLMEGLLFKFRAIRNFSTRYENLVPLSRLSARDLEEFKEAYRLSGEFIKEWTNAGGKIMGGTDDPAGGAGGLSVHLEMAMLVEVGLTPMQALQAQTSWAAEMLTARRKVPPQPPVGRIAEGVWADLVVLAANPLEDISNTRKIERVMKGGKFITLGYTPFFATTRPREASATPHTPEPEISAITPHVAVEGSPEFEMTVDGVGFVTNSVVRVNGVSVPTTFVNIRTLKAKIPAGAVARALPNRFIAPGPQQRIGVYGDRTVKITVFNGPPEGGASNSVSLRVLSKWMAEAKKE